MLRYLITVLISIIFLFNATLFAQSKLGELVVERTEYTKLQTDVVDTYRPGLLVVSVYTDIQGRCCKNAKNAGLMQHQP